MAEVAVVVGKHLGVGGKLEAHAGAKERGVVVKGNVCLFYAAVRGPFAQCQRDRTAGRRSSSDGSSS